MPFESPHYTQAPNDLFDCLMQDMTEVELKVTLAVIRGTLGYHRDGFDLSLKKMAQITGLSENGVMAGAEAAEKRGTIERINNGRQTTGWCVLFSDSASEARRRLPTSPSEAGLPHPVRQPTSPSEGQLRFKESIKKDKETLRASARTGLRELDLLFAELTGLSIPDSKTDRERRADASAWYQPMRRMQALANGQAADILRASIRQMRKDGLTISAPRSVENVFKSVYALQVAPAFVPVKVYE